MGVKIQTIKDIRFYLAKELKGVYGEQEIRIVSDLLIKNVTGITKMHQLYNDIHRVKAEEAAKIIEFVAELKTGKPVQYVLGETTFYNCIIKVNSSTLIPRPETEELVDIIIKENKGFKGKIIDFGTGSGCIAVALAANLPLSEISGIEISDEAIKIASENASSNNVNVSFIKGDIFNPDHKTIGKADIIVSNPPYVRSSEKELMQRNVLDFEPHLALFVTDTDPLIYYNAILKLAEDVLLPGGRLYFEINEAMGRSMIKLLELYKYSGIEIVPDINDKDRIIKCIKNG